MLERLRPQLCRYYLYPMDKGGPPPLFDAVMMNTFPIAKPHSAARPRA